MRPFRIKDKIQAILALQGSSRKHDLMWRYLKYVAVLSALAAILVCSTAAIWLHEIGAFRLDQRQADSLKHYSFQDNSIVFDKDGQRIGEFFDRYHIFTPIAEVPQHLINAILAIEDRTFYEHSGVDYSALLRAALARIRVGRITQGGSTITQQVVKQLILSPDRTIERKALEIAWALKLETTLTKDQLMEIYVNALFLGNGSYGVGAAARRYFNKDVRDLNPSESALLAGLFQLPSKYNPAKYPERAKRRQRMVLTALKNSQFITQQDFDAYSNTPLVYSTYKPINFEVAPWFIDYVKEQLPSIIPKGINHPGSGLRIYTTLDTKLQNLAEHSVRAANGQLLSLKTKYKINESMNAKGNAAQNAIEAAMLVTDHRTGGILAMVGGRDYQLSQFNRTVSAKRSPGSAFKPIVYTEAIMRGFKWSDVILVSPINIANYKPFTPEDDFLSETTMLRSFYRSMNTPTVEIATRIGLDPIIERARSLGIESLVKPEFGSTLGSSDVTMMDLARVYGTFANSGKTEPLHAVVKVTDSEGKILYQRPDRTQAKPALTPQVSHLITKGMQAVLSSGTASASKDLAPFAAGKTGTSNDSTDNWFCGYTPKLTSIVWVGTDQHTPIPGNATGGSLALPIWDTFIRGTIDPKRPEYFIEPKGVISADVHPVYGHKIKGGFKMWFLNTNQTAITESALENINSRSSGVYRRVFAH